MTRPQFALQFGLALLGFGILRTQIGDGRRLQRLGNGAGVRRRLAAGFDLVVFGLRVERQRPRRGEPLVAGGELLVADQRVLGADEVVLRLVDRERVFGVAQPFLQFRQPAGKVAGGATDPRGLRLRGFGQIGLGDRVGEHRRLHRVDRPDVDVDDEGLVGLFHIDVADQGFQRRHLDELPLLGGRAQIDPEQAQQRSEQALGVAAAEFRILLQMGLADHLQQHIVRGDHAHLALDHHRKAGKVRGARRQFAIDQLQFAGVDVKLGAGGVFRCQALADGHRDAGADQRGRGDCDLPPPQQLDQIEQAEATQCRHCGGPGIGLGLVYRLVIDKHRPQLPFQLPHTSAEGLLFALRHTRRTSTRQQRNREN